MVKQIDREDREILEAKLQKYREDPASDTVKNNIKEDKSKEAGIDSKISEVEGIIDQYQNIITLADEIANMIQTKSKDVKVSFNPDQDITLRDSIRRVFGIDTDKVEYWMYKECLELKEELAKEDREALRNT